jgi:hypothetical protein
MASISLTASVQSLAEGSYPFQLHLPVADGNEWSYRQMDGQFSVTAVADAHLSNVALCQGADCNMTAANVFESTNGALGPVFVRVSAADVHGFAILRSGETLSVITSGPRNLTQTAPAVFEDVKKLYVAILTSLTVAGNYVVELVSPLSRVVKASFTLICAQGYVASSQGECLPRRNICQTATADPPNGGFLVHGTMVLLNLASARSVELTPVSNATSFAVSSGQATVRFRDAPQAFC